MGNDDARRVVEARIPGCHGGGHGQRAGAGGAAGAAGTGGGSRLGAARRAPRRRHGRARAFHRRAGARRSHRAHRRRVRSRGARTARGRRRRPRAGARLHRPAYAWRPAGRGVHAVPGDGRHHHRARAGRRQPLVAEGASRGGQPAGVDGCRRARDAGRQRRHTVGPWLAASSRRHRRRHAEAFGRAARTHAGDPGARPSRGRVRHVDGTRIRAWPICRAARAGQPRSRHRTPRRRRDEPHALGGCR